MSEIGGKEGDVSKALGWRDDVKVGGWGDEKPEVVDQSRRDFLMSSGMIVAGAVLATSGLGGEMPAQVTGGSLDAKVADNNELGIKVETIKSYEYDEMMAEIKKVSSDLIESLNHDYIVGLKDKGIDGFRVISQKMQESWAWKLGYGEEGKHPDEIGLDRVWYAMLEGELTREKLKELYVENVAGAYWAGEIVKSNRDQLNKLSDSDKTDEFNKQWGEGDVDYRQVVKDADGKVDIERDAMWNDRKFKSVRAVMLGLANNPVDVKICRRSRGARLNELVGMVVSEAESSNKDNWVWNGETRMFEISEGVKMKPVVDNAIGMVHGNQGEEMLMGIEDEILGMQEISENRRLAHGVWDRYAKSDEYSLDNAGALGLADNLMEYIDQELRVQGVLKQGETFINDAHVKNIVKGYADYYFSDDDRNKPRYENMVELIRLMSGVESVAQQVEVIKEGSQVAVPKGEEDFFQNWPKNEVGEVDWGKVDFALVQEREGGYLYQKGPIENYNERKQYGDLMPLRAFMANCLVGSESFGQIERRFRDNDGNFVIEASEWRNVIEEALGVMVNTKTDDSWFARDDNGKWRSDFADSAFGNVHTDGSSGEPKSSDLYNKLVQMEKDKY